MSDTGIDLSKIFKEQTEPNEAQAVQEQPQLIQLEQPQQPQLELQLQPQQLEQPLQQLEQLEQPQLAVQDIDGWGATPEESLQPRPNPIKFKDCPPPNSYDFSQLDQQQQNYCKGRGLQKLAAWNKGLKTNKCPPEEKADTSGWDEKRKADCKKFWEFEKHASNMVVYLIIAMLVCDVLLFTELFIHNETYILGMHITRMIIFLSIIVLAIINFAKGYRQGPVNAIFDVIAKFITFAILLAYTITIGIRYQNDENKSTMGVLMIIGGSIFTLMTLIFFVWGIVDIVRHPGEPAMLSQTQFMFWSVFGIFVSVYAIIKHRFMGGSGDHDNTPLPPTPLPRSSVPSPAATATQLPSKEPVQGIQTTK